MLDCRQKIFIGMAFVFLLVFAGCTQVEVTQPATTVSVVSPGAPTQVVVRILNLDLRVESSPAPPTPTPLPTLPPLPTPMPAISPSASAATSTVPTCTNSAEFVKNLSIADNTALKPGAMFAKIWQVKNTGTCTWTPFYALVYASGESMGSPAMLSLPQTVKPGDTVDIRLSLVAPAIPNTYTGYWYLRDESGVLFGLGPDGTQPLGITIVVRPLPKTPT
jgi:hypothetical protein